MCGIAGIYSFSKGTDLGAGIRAMADSLTHRGPDDAGYFVSGRIALGHRRLSIIDLEGGRQPIFNEDGTIAIVYNGEVFNYRELKDELAAMGHRFTTNSDTETLIHAYEEWGDDFVQKLRGMFAFCIWDGKRERALIVRDRLGIKPLFYARYSGKLFFASEMKAILQEDSFKRDIDEEALASYFMYSYIPAPLTIFRGIKKLLPGHMMIINEDGITVRKYWDLFFAPDSRKKEDDFVHESLELLKESVRLRMISDVPVGAFLSGGVDSSSVVALMSGQTGKPVNTFTIGFGGSTGSFDDERKYAKMVADMYRTNHTEYEVKPSVNGLIDRIITAFDEPFSDDSTIPSYYVYELARKNVKVALSGLGGDEAFCGYERYLGFQLGAIYEKIPSLIRERVIRGLVEGLGEDANGGNRISRMKRFVRSSSPDHGHRYLGFITKVNGKYRPSLFAAPEMKEAVESSKRLFLDPFRADNASDPLDKALYCDMKTYLPEDILACTDRLSMHHSLEVRVPFLDHKLIEYAATIPSEVKLRRFKKKHILKKAVSPLLPSQVITHRKQGFVGPLAMWLKSDLKDYTLKALSEESLALHGLIDPGTVRLILEEHYSGRENNESLIWTLLVFQRWFELYMCGGKEAVHAGC